MKKIILLLFVLSFLNINAQTDSLGRKMVKYTIDFKFTDGIYLDFEQVKNNNPVPKSRIVSADDRNEPDFYTKVFQTDPVLFYDNLGNQMEVKLKNVWGYCDKGILYVHYNDEFNRIGIIGSIAHFVANKTTYDNFNNGYYSYYDYYRPPSTSSEMRQYLLNFTTGEIMEYGPASLEIVLMADPELYDEYNNLSRKKKRQMVFLYMRKYNEKHPLYLPQ